MRRSYAFAALVFLALGTPLAAQGIPQSEYAARRNGLMADLGDAVVVAFGASEPAALWQPFRQHPAFRWLTSFDAPDAVLVLARRGPSPTSYVFVLPPEPRYQLYVGIPDDSATVARESGLVLRPMTALRPTLDSLAGAGLAFYTLRDFGSGDASARDSVTLGARFMADFARAHPGLAVEDAHPRVDRLRAAKSANELALLRRAIEITDSAQLAAIRSVRPGMNERQVQAVIESTFLDQGAEGPAFSSIVGSGPNSTTLHYMRNDRAMRAAEVVVMDIGASFQGYAADVTRTVPVSGRFTPEQRAIYQVVRDAQTAAERVARVGGTGAAWQAAADSVIAAGLAQLGLIESADAEFDPPWRCTPGSRLCKQLSLFLPHGLGHGIGLEVHDPALYYYGERTFQDGEVLTIEPGIYVNPEVLRILPDTPRNRAMLEKIRPALERYRGTGVRIEDDYLVTRAGLEWLSRAPREIVEIEALMAKTLP